MREFEPSELCADRKIYDYKKRQIYVEKSLLIIDQSAKIIKCGKECETIKDCIPDDCVYLSPLILGKVDEFACARKMLDYMLHKYLGKPSILGYGEALVFLHENLNAVDWKVYSDLIYITGVKNVVIMDENVKGKPEHVSWEDVIWQMKDVNKNLRYAIEISKDEPMDYLRYSIEELNRKCEHWGLDEVKLTVDGL